MANKLQELAQASAAAAAGAARATMNRAVAGLDAISGRPPSFLAEMQALVRGGREDAWNALIPAFPDSQHANREPGSPGSPTPQMTTEALTGRDVNLQHDAMARQAQPQQHQAQSQRQPEIEPER